MRGRAVETAPWGLRHDVRLRGLRRMTTRWSGAMVCARSAGEDARAMADGRWGGWRLPPLAAVAAGAALAADPAALRASRAGLTSLSAPPLARAGKPIGGREPCTLPRARVLQAAYAAFVASGLQARVHPPATSPYANPLALYLLQAA